MYVVKKCENYSSYDRNKWVDVHVTPDKNDAEAFYQQEYRLLLESDPAMSRDTIEQRVQWAYLPTYYQRAKVIHNGTAFAILRSSAEKYQSVPKRPDRTELLDNILS